MCNHDSHLILGLVYHPRRNLYSFFLSPHPSKILAFKKKNLCIYSMGFAGSVLLCMDFL